MRSIPLTRNLFAIVDDEDYEEHSKYNWFPLFIRKKDGSVRNIYAYRGKMTNYKRRAIYLHREILGITDGKIKIDHKDHNGLNCQKQNMRACLHHQNLANSKMRPDNTSGFKGVSWYKAYNKWASQIDYKGKHHNLGYFDDINDAVKTRKEAEVKYFGEYACER